MKYELVCLAAPTESLRPCKRYISLSWHVRKKARLLILTASWVTREKRRRVYHALARTDKSISILGPALQSELRRIWLLRSFPGQRRLHAGT
jgi:hypothetical protein